MAGSDPRHFHAFMSPLQIIAGFILTHLVGAGLMACGQDGSPQ
jgi:hypothetical protein